MIIFTPTLVSKNQPTERKYFDLGFPWEKPKPRAKMHLCEELHHKMSENPSGIEKNTEEFS